ncbi:unnamed protein product [Pleuronectes platessa]|uniref:Uncharacterized protein n=1 Tax=Pleuronectes platessa TaxID=8262 RepID=A0A9N7V0N5_PLEPL|nr:unnamed protein product [Pleuronectes platessa]
MPSPHKDRRYWKGGNEQDSASGETHRGSQLSLSQEEGLQVVACTDTGGHPPHRSAGSHQSPPQQSISFRHPIHTFSQSPQMKAELQLSLTEEGSDEDDGDAAVAQVAADASATPARSSDREDEGETAHCGRGRLFQG